MDKLIQDSNAVAMVLLPKSALEELNASISDLKEMIQGKALKEVSSQWVESDEARRMLGVSPKTWQSYRDSRVLPFSQFGRKIYVRRSDIESFLESHMVKKSN